MKKKDLIYVGIQILLFILLLIVKDYHIRLPKLLIVLGLICIIIGVLVAVLAVVQLNKNLSPFPSPKANGFLITNGLFSLIRHPIYFGIILSSFGYSLYQESIYKMVVTVLLFFLFHYKSAYEEKLLSEKFSEYNAYSKKTWKMIPFIL